MKKVFLIAFAIFCTQGIWAQTVSEEPDSISASRVNNEVDDDDEGNPSVASPQVNNNKAFLKGKAKTNEVDLQQLAEEAHAARVAVDELTKIMQLDQDEDPLANYILPSKGSRWAQSVSTIVEIKQAGDHDTDNEGITGSNVSEEKFDQATDNAKPGSGLGVSIGLQWSILYGNYKQGQWNPNKHWVTLDMGFLVSAKKSDQFQTYDAFGFVGTSIGADQLWGVSIKFLFGAGSNVGYLYDLDDPDEDPEMDPKICPKLGGEVSLNLGTSSGLIPGGKELFLKVIYSLENNYFDREQNLYRFSTDKVVSIGIRMRLFHKHKKKGGQ